MTKDINGDTTFNLQCDECGRKIEKTFEWLKKNPTVDCCGSTYKIPGRRGILARVKRLEKLQAKKK